MRTLSSTPILLFALVLGGCGTSPPSQGAGPRLSSEEMASDSSLLVPPGLGTLLQDQITLRIQQGDLLVKVTPLEEWVIRLTAPDTYVRLSSMARTYGARAASERFAGPEALFLVSFFSYVPDVTYEPEDLLLVNRGLRYRPRGIAAVTPYWGTQRLGQQQTQMAVFAFDGNIDLERDLVVEYQGLRNEIWRDRVVPLLRTELAKVRARAGGGGSTGR